ncbi:DUF4468 domain-containing protein [Flammeovirgaceae bacterium SG7u.111]|nr:DUF4468 domain-containing protein [Flammeovirgaceae bacterium SG7u.132]WPO34650.1 DUF4468 domain-containing protein [Flammeovirgaceae bacterium SG7u.111]
MKKLTTAFLLLLGCVYNFSQAQDFPLPTNETGAIEYTEVVELADFDKERLFKNAKGFCESLVPNKKTRKGSFSEDAEAGTVTITNTFKVLKKSVTKQVSGEIRYDLEIEVKDGKYRYFFKSFAFTPYTRDRYGKFKPMKRETTVMIPVSKPLSVGEGLWKKHLESCNNHVTYWIEQLKFEMQRKADEPKKKEKKKEEIQW